MRNLEKELKNKSIDYQKLIQYGFENEDEKYIFKTKICNNQFEIVIVLSSKEKTSKVIDLANEDEYILVDIEDATGEFVGSVRYEYENLLKDVFEKCTNLNIFKTRQAHKIIEYIKEKYNDELEFLWEKFYNNAIWRNQINDKWYGLLLTVTEDKLNLNSHKEIEIIDLRYSKEDIQNVVDNKKIFSGYHMNKKSWITIKLDDSVDTQKIFELIDNSYKLSVGKKSGLAGDKLAQKVFDYLTIIPKGKVVTYKQVAEYIGNSGLARTVGNILHKNPDGDKYPCYKVLNSKGELAEAFVFGGKSVQKQRLENDGVKVIDNKVDLKIYQWREESIN